MPTDTPDYTVCNDARGHELYVVGSDVAYRIQSRTPRPAALQAIIQMAESDELMSYNSAKTCSISDTAD